MKKHLLGKGFTLIELLIVISIVSLLSTVIMYSVSEAKISADDAHKKTEVAQVRNALEIYKDGNNTAPRGLNAATSVVYNENSPEYQSAMQQLVDANTMPEIPTSPNGVDYFYLSQEGGDGVFGAVLRSNNEIDDNYGCSGEAASYIIEFDRDSLIQNAEDCLDGDCDPVEEGGSSNGDGGGEQTINFEWESNTRHHNTTYAEYDCNNLTLSGFSNWRLPTIAELQYVYNNNPFPDYISGSSYDESAPSVDVANNNYGYMAAKSFFISSERFTGTTVEGYYLENDVKGVHMQDGRTYAVSSSRPEWNYRCFRTIN